MSNGVKKSIYPGKIIERRIFIRIFALFIVFTIGTAGVYALDDPKKAEESMVIEKKIEKEKEEALIDHFYNEGKRLLDEGDYEASVEQFSRILEINPKHSGARRGIKKVKNKWMKDEKLKSPEEMAKKLLKDGRVKYAREDYEGAIEDFQNSLVMDYTNEDTLAWLKKARRRKILKESELEEDDLLKDIEVATQKKTAQERLAMLEVEEAYMPPEKPERKPVEIEELISPEEEREERARKALLEKLRQKMVPAVSLTDADIRDVIRQLMEITNVTIVIDEGALAEAVGQAPLRLTFSTVNPLPLLEVLDIALRATELNYRIEPNYIWISTPEKLEKQNLVTKTYRLKYGVRRIRKVELKEFETKSGSSE